jgi:hypothetical protein
MNMEGQEHLDLEFGDMTVDPLESGYLDTEAQALNMGLNEGDLAPQGLYRRASYPTTFGHEHMDPSQHGVTFGVEVTPKKSPLKLIAAGAIGAGVGFALGGPVGAAAGLALGLGAEEGYERFKPHPVAALPPPAPAPAPVVVAPSAAPTAAGNPAPAAA